MIRKIKVIGTIFICLIITSNNILGAGATVTSELLKKVPEIIFTALTGEGIKFCFDYLGKLMNPQALDKNLVAVENEWRPTDSEIANEIRTLRLNIDSQTTWNEYHKMAKDTIKSIDKRVSYLELKVKWLEDKSENHEGRLDKHDNDISDLKEKVNKPKIVVRTPADPIEMWKPQSNTGKGPLYDAGGGAAAGALAGQLIGRNTKYTLIGAAVGGVAGAGIGQMMDNQAQAFQQVLADSQAMSMLREPDTTTPYNIGNTGGQQQLQPQIIALTLKSDVFFKTGSAEVFHGAYSEIDRIAQVMREYPQTTITIEGHTDSTGSRADNQALSERRAQSVSNLLTQRAIEYFRISTVGYGQDRPIASNNDAHGRQLNRRVEIRIRPAS